MIDTDKTAANQGELTALRLPELRKIAGELGLKGTSGLRKGDLINAINTARSGKTTAPAAQAAAEEKPAPRTRSRRAVKATAPAQATAPQDNDAPAQASETPEAVAPAAEPTQSEAPARRGRRRVTAAPTTPPAAPAAPEVREPERTDSADNQQVQSADQSSDDNDDQDNRFESRSAARRARRNRQRQTHRDTQDDHDAQDSEQTALTVTPEAAPQAESAENNAAERSNDQQSSDEQSSDQHSSDQDSGDNRRHNQRRDRRGNRNDHRRDRNDNRQHNRNDNRDTGEQSEQQSAENQQDSQDRNDNRNDRNDQDNNDRRQSGGGHNNRQHNRNDQDDNGDDRRGRRGRRNRRGRDRDNRNDNRTDHRGDNQNDHQGDTQQEEQLQNVAGILDIVDTNVAFVRTTGYHPAPSDVFVNNQLIRRMGLRSGDAITGQVRMNQGGNQGGQGGHGGRNRQKYNNLTRVESINGLPAEEARNRPEFNKLTPLYPNQRLRLETEQKVLTTRVIDLIMPIGKGQRALIVSPPKAGKTTILQNIANAIATNNPECYLMVVLVDERPEEVTDMQRSVKGEVIASTFDRPPGEHTAVAELAIERAKRLVEQGQDVVVLLDSITRLGRAYNNSSPASGRILSGGVDSNALYPPKRFLGAARNIEHGGSLTIIATAMVETGSAGDTVIFEEFKGTGNAELKLDRKISERRVFPAVDVNPSGTRKDELLLNPDEARIMHKLRRILSALDNQQAIDLLIKQLKKTKSNAEFLMQVASSAPMAGTENDEEYS